MYVDTLK